jgi:tellurite resistance protein TehA-like permease
MKTLFKALSIMFFLVLMVGFGLCGLLGIASGSSYKTSGDGLSIFLLGCAGVGISIALCFVIYRIAKYGSVFRIAKKSDFTTQPDQDKSEQ